MRNGDPNDYGSSWLSATRVASPPRGRLTVELDVDVCIIGAGLAGLTVAREVARRGWSVVVLEAQSVAWNASGRNTGFVRPGFAADPAKLVERVGLDHARKLWALSEAGAEYVRKVARDPSMPGVALSEGGWLHVSKTDDTRAMLSQAELLRDGLGATVDLWPAEQVREALRSPAYFGGLHDPKGFSIHALNYALGLAADAEAHGARIYENTAALQIDPAGVRKRVATQDARVRAAHVVLAGNIHLAELMPQFASTLLPAHTYVIVTAPLGDALREAMRFPGAVSDTDLADNRYSVVEGDRLMWSGRSTVWRGRPQGYVETLINHIRHTFPQLDHVKAEFAWTGLSGNTVHLMPQIGEITPGLWLLSGFGGHGLNTTAMGGDVVARAILDGDKTWELFSPFALVWSGGLPGRVAQQVFYWSRRASEIIGARLARRREAIRLRAEEERAVAAELAASKAAADAAKSEAAAATAEPAVEAPPVVPPQEVKAVSAEAAMPASPSASRRSKRPPAAPSDSKAESRA